MAEAMHQHSAGQILVQVRVPTLILSGANDTFTRQFDVDQKDGSFFLTEFFKSGHFVTIAGARTDGLNGVRWPFPSVRSIRLARWSTGPRCGLTDEFSAPCWSVRRIPTHGRLTPCGN